MKTEEMFDALVRYHIQYNLEGCLGRIKDGRVLGEYGQPLIEGKDASVPHHGVLIVANGETLAERLTRDKVVHDDEVEFNEIKTIVYLYDIFDRMRNDDGAFIFDGKNSRIAKVGEINNGFPMPNGFNLYSFIPPDFFISGADAFGDNRLGTKTRLAIRIPHGYDNTQTFQIKRSSYGRLGIGKVTHFDTRGLVEEFYLQSGRSEGPFINQEHGIVGVHNKYDRIEDRLVRVEQKLWHDDI